MRTVINPTRQEAVKNFTPIPTPSPVDGGRESNPVTEMAKARSLSTGMGVKKLTNLLMVTLLLVSGLLTMTATAYAQDDASEPMGDPSTVTDDEVNEIASKLYCPVCENEPLDDCMATTCFQWREDIRNQLAEGASEEEIVDYFVANFGDRVVGIPTDEGSRTLSLAGPIVAGIVALLGVGWTLFRWRNQGTRPATATTANTSTGTYTENDDYRSRLEQDLHK